METTEIEIARPSIWRRLKWPIFFLLALVAAIALAWSGYRLLTLRLWLVRAHREFSAKHYKSAEFWTGRALGANQLSVDATRLMAEIEEAQDLPTALTWRIRAVQCAPGSAEDILAWARCAMRFDQLETALRALKILPQDFKNGSAEYHELMAGCAMANHDFGVAQGLFFRAVQLDRGNPVHLLNLAAFLVANSPSLAVRASAVHDIEGLAGDPRVRLSAVRTLLADALRNKDATRARRFAGKLRSMPEHNFSDDLSCLDAVTSDPAFRPALEAVEHQARADAKWVAETADWLNSRGMAGEALRWQAGLPEKLLSNVRVQIATAESQLALRHWKELEIFLGARQWADCEFLRRAMLIRCKRETAQPWEKEWTNLTTAVEANTRDALLLAQLALGWNWRNESTRLLWKAATKPATASQALQLLWSLYRSANDTGALLHVATAQLNFDPSNPANKNNVAFLWLLLNGPSENYLRMAREASQANPMVPEWTVTYAFALHRAGRDSEAAQELKKLLPDAIKRPGIALYYALVLAGSGDAARARDYLGKLNPTGLLPEEQKLAADLAKELNVTRR